MQKHRNINIESHFSFQKFENKKEKTRQTDQKFRKHRENCQFSMIEKDKFAKKSRQIDMNFKKNHENLDIDSYGYFPTPNESNHHLSPPPNCVIVSIPCPPSLCLKQKNKMENFCKIR